MKYSKASTVAFTCQTLMNDYGEGENLKVSFFIVTDRILSTKNAAKLFSFLPSLFSSFFFTG